MTWPHTDGQNFGCPRQHVTGQARRELRAYVAELYSRGLAVGAIASRIGRSGQMVRRLLAEGGVALRPPRQTGQKAEAADEST